MSDFKPFDDQFAGVLAALSAAGRRKLAGDIAKQHRTAQQQRIKQQKAPDGSPYQVRKRQPLRAKTGRIKRAIFQKLRTNMYMKASGRESGAVVEFTSKVQRIACVHRTALKTGQTRMLILLSTLNANYLVWAWKKKNLLKCL